MTTQSAARQAIDCQTVGAYNEAHYFDSRSTLRRADKAMDKSSEAQAQFQPIINLIKNVQELNLQCRQIINQLHVRTQQGAMRSLQPRSLPQLYNIDAEGLLRYINCVLIPAQEALRS